MGMFVMERKMQIFMATFLAHSQIHKLLIIIRASHGLLLRIGTQQQVIKFHPRFRSKQLQVVVVSHVASTQRMCTHLGTTNWCTDEGNNKPHH
mmetsp:Transcript_43705/g.44394  ORF Transcript_43705/g.44394 Transcript_43705/m.44394 type:complete len:93 (-) Transcript_43705:563-841(-)